MAGLFSSLLVLTAAPRRTPRASHSIGISDPSARIWNRYLLHSSLASVSSRPSLGSLGATHGARIVNVDVPLRNLSPCAATDFRSFKSVTSMSEPTIRKKYVEKIVNAVNALKPDLIAVTGDVVDGSVRELAAHTRAARSVARAAWRILRYR